MKTDNETIEHMRAHAARTYPEEGCGFLIGTFEENGDVLVVDAEPVENVRESLKERRYRIDPDDLVKAEARAGASGYDVVGFYHSHPDHPARPSETDLAEATFPGYAYVIVSVTRGRPGEIRLWSLRDDRTGFEEREIEILTDKLETQ